MTKPQKKNEPLEIEEVEEDKAPLVEHLRELRARLTYSMIAFILAAGASYTLAPDIYQFLVAPLAEAYEGEQNRRLIFTGLTEAFFSYVKLALFAGFIISFPILAWNFYAFVAPGLYKNEKKVVLPFLLSAPVLFVAGMAMAYYFIFPLAWNFFLSFEMAAGEGALPIQLEARVSEYLSLVMRLILAFGIAFQLPIIIMLLAYAGFATQKGLKAKRKYALIAIFVIAAIITPPDVISQIGLAIPLLVLYELSILACGMVENKKEKNG